MIKTLAFIVLILSVAYTNQAACSNVAAKTDGTIYNAGAAPTGALPITCDKCMTRSDYSAANEVDQDGASAATVQKMKVMCTACMDGYQFAEGKSATTEYLSGSYSDVNTRNETKMGHVSIVR